MLTGWKHWVAKPFDPLFKKDGAGLEVPVTITGTKSDMKFGVDKGKLKKQNLLQAQGQAGGEDRGRQDRRETGAHVTRNRKEKAEIPSSKDRQQQQE